ncbi:SH3 domain-containing protein [Streptomyces sp. NPDC047860]|uniref:SH3 domain-containing protein n=1 Tax=Streptomyces sp. NPDC047860 TaxID=3155743 RepID=UPI00340A5FB6
MAPRHPFSHRLPIALAAGALAVATAVTPALAADDPNQGNQGWWSQQGGNGNNNGGNGNNFGGNGNNNAGNNNFGGNNGHNSGGNANNFGGNGNNNAGNNNFGGNGNNGGGNGNNNGGNNFGGNGNNNNGGGFGQQGGNDGRQQQAGRNQGDFKGVVTANRLALRTAPNRGARIIRFAHRGEVVSIFCKVPGDRVNGNPLWYLLTDGTWAWGPAAHIDNIGPAPRWC